MEFRFKSSECNGEELVKNFKKDFETSFLEEQEFSEFKEGVTGTVKEIHLNNAYVLCQDYNNKNSENFSLQVVQNCPAFLLQFVISGQVSISEYDHVNKTLSLSKNTYNLFYIPASKYAYKYLNHKKRVLNVYFTESFLISKMGSDFIKELKHYPKVQKGNRLCALFNKSLVLSKPLKHIVNEFLNCPLNGTARQSYLESKLTELVLIALTSRDHNVTEHKLRKDEKTTLTNVEHYIQTHLKSELSIENLSALAGFSTSKFKSIFKEVYGMPVFKYITALRIEKAKQLIEEHDYTIAQASYEVGYKNPQHFTVAFKKKMGYLPSELIK